MSQSAEILRINPQSPELPEWESKIDLVRRTVAAGATPDELELFFHQARRAGLDPLAKQIYFVKRQGKGVVQVGIDGLRLIADRTGKYAGSGDAEFGPGNERGYPSSAKVVVYKMVQGQRCPFGATARWDEYFPGDSQGFQWKRMPHAMLAKCAEALALRKAFPADMSGLYVHEEMEQAGTGEQPPRPQQAQPNVPQPIPEGASDGEKIRNAGLFFKRTIKGTAAELAEFKEACNPNTWHIVALDAEQKGVVTFVGLMRFAKEGVVPMTEDEIEAANAAAEAEAQAQGEHEAWEAAQESAHA